MRYHFKYARMAVTPKTRDKRWWACREEETGTPLVGMEGVAATAENSIEVSRKIKIELSYDLAVLLLDIYPKNPTKTLIWKDTCTPMFTAAVFIIAKVSTDRWRRYVHIYMQCYSAIKNNEIMLFAVTWMQLEIVILSEVNQKKKDKYHMISLICGI